MPLDVAEVTKVYRLYEKPIDRLKESMSIPIRITTGIFTR